SLTLNSTAAATVALSASPAHPAVLSPVTLTFNTTTAKLDLTNNELITTATVDSIRTKIIAGQIFTSITDGVLGYADIGSGQTEVRYTLRGDTDLDGTVGVGDLGALATNYGASTGATWAEGDFNNDGAVGVGDLGSLATNYGATIGGGLSAAASPASLPSPEA